HAIGKYNWPDLDSKYYSITGKHSYEDAKEQLDTIVIGLRPIGIYPPNDYGTIQYLLDLFRRYIRYEHDMNNVFRAPPETLGMRSGDCDDWSILASAAFADAGIPSAIVFVKSLDGTKAHAMVLVQSSENLPFCNYSDLTGFGLPSGRWYIVEPQYTLGDHLQNPHYCEEWRITAVVLVKSPY
ncbi:unnamed protein product, partial [marine sediment metagenome]